MSKSKSARRKTAPPKPKPQKQRAADTYVSRAQQLYQNGELEQAIAVLQQAVNLAPNDAQLQHTIGKRLAENNNRKEAVQHYDKALIINPDFVPSLVELAQDSHKHNDLEKADLLIQKALPQADINPSVHVVHGTIQQKRGDFPDAVESFRTALRIRLEGDFPTQSPKEKTNNFNQDETVTLMWETLSILAKSGIHAFPMGGTLLGLVREGDLLPHDKDIDFGIPYSEMDRARDCLEANGWIAALESTLLINPRSFVHPVKNITLDIGGFVVDRATGESFYGFWYQDVPWHWQRYLRYSTIELEKKATPTGAPIWWPREPEMLLEADYGNWRIPDPSFNSVIGEKNLHSFSLLTQCYGFSRIYSSWERGQIAKALSMAQTVLGHVPTDELIQEIEAHLETIQASGHNGETGDDTTEGMIAQQSQ